MMDKDGSHEAAKPRREVLLPMERAPKDGTRILIWVRHRNWQYSVQSEFDQEGPDRWEGFVIASWTDFNGGGWVWYGHTGAHLGWLPLPVPDLRGFAASREKIGLTQSREGTKAEGVTE